MESFDHKRPVFLNRNMYNVFTNRVANNYKYALDKLFSLIKPDVDGCSKIITYHFSMKVSQMVRPSWIIMEAALEKGVCLQTACRIVLPSMNMICSRFEVFDHDQVQCCPFCKGQVQTMTMLRWRAASFHFQRHHQVSNMQLSFPFRNRNR